MDGANSKAGVFTYFVNARGLKLDSAQLDQDHPQTAMGRSKILTLMKLGSMMCFWVEVERGLEKAPPCSWGNAFLWELLAAHSQLCGSFCSTFSRENTAQLDHLGTCRAEQSPWKHPVSAASGPVP